MSRWADYGFPNKLKTTHIKRIYQGLIRALYERCIAVNEYQIIPFKFSTTHIVGFNNEALINTTLDYRLRSSRFQVWFDKCLLTIIPKYIDTEASQFTYSNFTVENLISYLNIQTWSSTDLWPNPTQLKPDPLMRRKFSLQWALDRYKILNSLKKMSGSEFGGLCKFGEDELASFDQQSFNWSNWPDEDSKSTIDPGYYNPSISCRITNYSEDEYHIDYSQNRNAIVTLNQKLSYGNNNYTPNVETYLYITALSNPGSTSWANYQKFKYYLLNTQKANFKAADSGWYITADFDSMWQPYEIEGAAEANKKFGVYAEYKVIFDFSVDSAGTQFYDSPEVYKDISYDDY